MWWRKNHFHFPQNEVFWCGKNPEPGHGVFKAKVYRVYQEVGDEEEEVGAAETSQQVVEDAWHWPDDGGDDVIAVMVVEDIDGDHHRHGFCVSLTRIYIIILLGLLGSQKMWKGFFLSYFHNSVTQLLISI